MNINPKHSNSLNHEEGVLQEPQNEFRRTKLLTLNSKKLSRNNSSPHPLKRNPNSKRKKENPLKKNLKFKEGKIFCNNLRKNIRV